MKSDTFSTNQEEILSYLDDKLIEALVTAVAMTRVSLARYRSVLPELAVSHSPRGLANMIHDWLWNHLRRQVDGLDTVTVEESGPIRELIVKGWIRIRVKRQSITGAVATYPTQMALDFYTQPEQLSLFDMPPAINLVFGYIWNSSEREIGSAVVAYPISTRKALWVYEIPEPSSRKGLPKQPESPSLDVPPKNEFPEGLADRS